MSLASLLAVGTPLADALAIAHRQGVIHHDVKPANVMVSDEGRVKVLDFGLARLEQPATAASGITTAVELSREGQIVGTLTHMSPEQARRGGMPEQMRADGAPAEHRLLGRRALGQFLNLTEGAEALVAMILAPVLDGAIGTPRPTAPNQGRPRTRPTAS